MKAITLNTCATCYYFNHKPQLVNGESMPVGCCLLVEFVTRLEPVTNKVMGSQPINVDDPTCEEYLTEQEYLSRSARRSAISTQERGT